MNKLILITWLCIQDINSFAQDNTSSEKLTIDVNYNVELLGLAYFIRFEGVDIDTKTIEIKGKVIPKKQWHAYGFYINEEYKKFSTSENLARSFTVADHLWLDYLIHLLVQVDNFPNAKLIPGIDTKHFINFSLRKDINEARQNATTFLEGLNDFHKEINFNEYIVNTRSYYEAALDEVRSSLPTFDVLKSIETFYGKTFNKYSLVPSLTIPRGMGFGISYTRNNRTSIFNVFGAFDFQSLQETNKLNLGFRVPQQLRELSIHEFGHSFVNPVIDQIPQETITKGERLFDPIKSAMSNQGYTTWKICLYEHFVRAGEVVIAKISGDQAGSERLRSEYVNNRKFIYLPTIIEELEGYSKKKIGYYDAVLNAIEKISKLK